MPTPAVAPTPTPAIAPTPAVSSTPPPVAPASAAGLGVVAPPPPPVAPAPTPPVAPRPPIAPAPSHAPTTRPPVAPPAPQSSPASETAPRVASPLPSPLAGIETRSWPVVMKDFYRLFTDGKDWGRDWELCLRRFIEIQEKDGHPVHLDLNRLPAGRRPPELTRWMKEKRPIVDRPIDVDRRVAPGAVRPSREHNDFEWGTLRRTGSCGLILVILSLSWWGSAVFNIERSPGFRAQAAWLDAVVDVSWALEFFAKIEVGARSTTPTASGKQSTETSAETNSSNRVMRSTRSGMSAVESTTAAARKRKAPYVAGPRSKRNKQ
ncbi:hypothetical protein PLICRDRAFT_177279 [Plicaturopsis crispa FD-325 SS-3]|nr:hypothetical protein PLICRDRAFT_177279 [Plicaturopsis crispa FD-325 SS-3]